MSLRPLQKATSERADATRRRLLDAGLNLFALHGYDATTTRALADIAEANLASIPYHFGGKDGLYRAVARLALEGLSTHMSGFLDQTENEIKSGIVSTEQATLLAEKLMAHYAEVALVTPMADRWMRFLGREQMEPTEVFDTVYESPVKRLRLQMVQLLSKISGLDVQHPRLMLTALQMIGLVYVFRTAQQSTQRDMGWQEMGQKEYEEIHSVILFNIRSILKGLQNNAL